MSVELAQPVEASIFRIRRYEEDDDGRERRQTAHDRKRSGQPQLYFTTPLTFRQRDHKRHDQQRSNPDRKRAAHLEWIRPEGRQGEIDHQTGNQPEIGHAEHIVPTAHRGEHHQSEHVGPETGSTLRAEHQHGCEAEHDEPAYHTYTIPEEISHGYP